MALSDPRRLTADEFFALPGELRHTELVDGEIVVDTPSRRHQDVLGYLYASMWVLQRAHPELGHPGLEMSVPVDRDNVFVPDLWWTVPAHTPGRDDNRHSGPPDLVIEVWSPTTWRHDRGRKRAGYEAMGVPELWLVDTPAETIHVARRSTAAAIGFDVTFDVVPGDTLTTPLIPGFAVDVTELFDR